MSVLDVANSYYRFTAQVIEAAIETVLAIFTAQTDPKAPTASWKSNRTRERLFVATSRAQLTIAQEAPTFVTRALDEQDVRSEPDADLVPTALAGVASDGRSLEDLLIQPLIEIEYALSKGLAEADAVASGYNSLEQIVDSQVADAGRDAVQVAMVAEPKATTYIRMLNPGACGRCAQLAGQKSKTLDAFKRHPRCRCYGIPSVENRADSLLTDGRAYFNSLSEPDQNRLFGKGRAEVIRAGGDFHRAINARAGMSAPGLTKGGQLMPAEIFKQAKGDREKAVQLLSANGYLN